MLTTLTLIALLSQSPSADLFITQAEIQGNYEVIRQTRAQALNPADIDDLHATLYTTDWTFIDGSGQSHTWTEMRKAETDAVAAALARGPIDALYQPIAKMSLSSDKCTATVTIVENRTTYKDTWIKSGDSWKMKVRQQLN